MGMEIPREATDFKQGLRSWHSRVVESIVEDFRGRCWSTHSRDEAREKASEFIESKFYVYVAHFGPNGTEVDILADAIRGVRKGDWRLVRGRILRDVDLLERMPGSDEIMTTALRNLVGSI